MKNNLQQKVTLSLLAGAMLFGTGYIANAYNGGNTASAIGSDAFRYWVHCQYQRCLCGYCI